LIGLAAVSVAFGNGQQETTGDAADGDEPELKVAMLIEGSITDGGWNQKPYEGLMAAKEEYDIEVAYTDNIAPNEQESIMRRYARNYDLVMANGYPFSDVLHRVSQEFTDTMFVGISIPKAGPNLMTARVERGEAGYMQGTIAAQMTETNKIGYISAFESPHIEKEISMLKKRVNELNPQAEVLVVYTNDWDDVNLAKQAANSLADKGVDVFGNAMDPGNVATIQVAKERDRDIYVIGMQSDVHELGPEVVLTSTITDTAMVVKNTIGDILEGKYQPGESFTYGFEEGANYMGTYGESMPEDLEKEVKNTADRLKSGDLKIDTNVKGWD
jgi:basic membrane protein A